MSDTQQAELVARLKETRKYAHLCDPTLARVAEWACTRHTSPKEALKAAKRKLHQAFGAYIEPKHLKQLETLVTELPLRAPLEQQMAVCRKAFDLHASTCERLPLLDTVFDDIFAITGMPGRVLDIACGLNPFALPWTRMSGLYCAWDIDERLIACINAFLERTGRPATAACRDVLADPPDEAYDVVFLLKALSCLERQETGAARSVLAALRTRHAVVSFPTRSLGGRDRGMQEHYRGFLEPIIEELGLRCHELPYPTETFYVLDYARRG